MIDSTDVDVKLKKGPKGQFIAYSDQCPGVTGEGQTEDSAVNHFWKAFSKFEDNQANQARAAKHQQEAKAAAATVPTKGKKAA